MFNKSNFPNDPKFAPKTLKEKTKELFPFQPQIDKAFDDFFIGAESFWSHFNDLMDLSHSSPSYPPYNLIKTDDGSTIVEIAIAGFQKENVKVTLEQISAGYQKLRVTAKRADEKVEDGKNYLHKGIAQRFFDRTFIIYDESEVEYAKVEDGLLQVKINKIKKEEKQNVKEIAIQ